MNAIIFDSGPIISLTTNNLLWILEAMKKHFDGEFYITEAVKKELIGHPLHTKRFKFEALQVLNLVEKGIIKVVPSADLRKMADDLVVLCNHVFKMRGEWMRIIHYPEMEVMAAAILMNADAAIFDERTARMLVENHRDLQRILEHHFKAKASVDSKSLEELKRLTKGVETLRSVEIVVIAYELGLLDEYVADIPSAKEMLLDSLLWGLKLRGCAISRREIEEIVKIECRSRP